MTTTALSITYISFLIYLSIVRFVYWATSKKEGCPISDEDKWNPIKWKSFAYGTFMEWLIPPHILEQLWERYTNKDCQRCLEKGCCVNCGCDTYAKMLDPNALCSNAHWDTMMSKKQWALRKEFLKNQATKEKNKPLEQLISDNFYKNPKSKSSISYSSVYDKEFKCTIEKAKVVTYDENKNGAGFMEVPDEKYLWGNYNVEDTLESLKEAYNETKN